MGREMPSIIIGMLSYHKKIVAAVLVLVGAGTALIIGAALETQIYYVHVDEFLSSEAGQRGRAMRISGTVQDGSWTRGTEVLDHAFSIYDPGSEGELKVRYRGPVPDSFKEGGDVVVEGTYHGGLSLEASTIMTKCPSKYEPADSP